VYVFNSSRVIVLLCGFSDFLSIVLPLCFSVLGQKVDFTVLSVFLFVVRRTLLVCNLLRFIYDDIFNIGLLVNLSRSAFVAVSRAASLHFIIVQHRLRLQT